MTLPAGGSGETIAYPLNRLTESAQQLRMTAHRALDTHEQTWQAVQAYIDSYPAFMQPPLLTLLDTYQKRLRATYTMYLSFANWLDYAHNEMDHTDGTISQSFNEFLANPKG